MANNINGGYKAYECTECGREEEHETNHWGDIYPFCKTCEKQTVWKVNDPVPEGAWIPCKWVPTEVTVVNQ